MKPLIEVRKKDAPEVVYTFDNLVSAERFLDCRRDGGLDSRTNREVYEIIKEEEKL